MIECLLKTALSNPLKGLAPENYLSAEKIIVSSHITTLFQCLFLSPLTLRVRRKQKIPFLH